MPVAARKFLGLRTHTVGQSQWSPQTFYDTGDVVQDRGHTFRARMPVARGHRPTAVGDGSAEYRQMLVDDCDKGWAGGLTTGGLTGTHYVVTSTADTNTAGTLRYGAKLPNTWITFDPDVFPLDDPATINCTTNIDVAPNVTIDGRGAGVRISKYPLSYRSDPSSPLTASRGHHTANILDAYIEFVDFPNGTSVVQFGGNNPSHRGGADLVYIHHVTVHDIEDQNMSNGEHDNHVSRSTIDWSRFGPSPGPQMMTHVTHGGMKLFSVDATDVTNDTITTLDSQGNPTNHDLISLVGGARAAFDVNLFRRDDLTAHPFPSGSGFAAGPAYSVRHVGIAGQPQKDFTADPATKRLTVTAHGYNDGDPVVLIGNTAGTNLPGGLRNGYVYYVNSKTTDTFKLAVNSDPSAGAKGFSTTGSGTLKVQKADLTKFQVSVDSGQTGWAAVNITGAGTGWYLETTEPVYFENGKGPQWGSHHPDDVPDTFVPFTADPATDIITTPDHPHLLSDGDRVRFWAQAGGIPTNVTQGTTYYVDVLTDKTFKLSLTNGGAAADVQSTAGAEQAVTFDGTTHTVNATGHGLVGGDMVTFYGPVPDTITLGAIYWVANGDDATITANTFQITDRKGDPIELISTGSGTLIKKPPLVQLIMGPNRASMTLCDFRNMKLRSPKWQVGWYHEWNTRKFKWGDPDRGDDVGGFGTEFADHAQGLVENCIYRPYATGEAHYWSAFTNPAENIPTRGPSVYGVNVDAGSIGPPDPHDWTGGTAVIIHGPRFEGAATTRNAQSGQTVIVNASELDWYDGVTRLVPYDYDPIPVALDPFILDTILDRGCGNVQPWELLS